MREITDLDGKPWEIRITVGTVMKIQAGIIPEFLENEQLACQQMADLSQKKLLLCRVLWAICQRQAVERGIDEDTFFCSFTGEALQAAYATVVEAVADFFPHLAPMTTRILKELAEQRAQIRSVLASTSESIPVGQLGKLDTDELKRKLSSTPESSEG